MSEAATLSPEQQETRRQVRHYILENLMFSDDPSQLPDDASLLDRGIIDSTGVLEVVMFIEEAFEVKVRDSDLLPENFDSVARIADFVARLRAA
ncbi:MAG: acyl carrier protein [Pseudoxanthomonas sp.]